MRASDLSVRVQLAAEKLALREAEVVRFFKMLTGHESIGSQALLRRMGLPKAQFGRLINYFSDLLDENGSGRVALQPAAVSMVRELVESCRFDQEDAYRQIVRVLKKYRPQHPAPAREFDQFTATVNTVARRALYLQARGDLGGRDILFLGDDDLIAVAVAMLKQTRRVTVLEIDPRLIELMREICTQEKLSIELVEHDLRRPIPSNLVEKFDVVFTDPPYTPEGISLFLNRGIEVVKPRLTSRIYLCYGNSDRARERQLSIQRLITDKGLLINTKLYQFNRYHGATSIGSASSLHLLDWTPQTRETEIGQWDIYTMRGGKIR